MNLFLFITNMGVIAFVAAFVAITPMLNRKSLLFGVRVPELAANLPEARRMKRDYAARTAAGCLAVLALAVLQYVFEPDLTLLAILYFPLLLIGVQFAAYYPQWKKARALKEARGWQTPFTGSAETRSAADREKLSSLPWGWYIASAALMLVLAGWTLAIYPSLPDQIVMNWDFNMEPTGLVDKTVMNLLAMPFVALGTVALMAGTNVMIYRQKLQISAEHPALSFAQHRMYRRMMSRALGFMTFCMALMFAGLHPPSAGMFVPPGWYIPTLIAVTMGLGMLPVLYVPIRAGQSGCRLKPALDPQDALAGQASPEIDTPNIKVAHPGRGDDQYWKLGIIYCNPDDPALLVENRFGGNSGFNYARTPVKLLVTLGAVLLAAAYAAITYVAVTRPFGG